VERAQCAGVLRPAVAANVLAAAPLGLLGWGCCSGRSCRTTPPAAKPCYGLGLALLGTLCFSAGNMLSSLQQKAGLKPMTTNAWGMLYGAAMLAVYCLVSGIPFEMEWNTRYIGSLLYLVIPGSVIGFTAYLTLVGRMGPERAAYCTVLFPLVALNVSAFAEGYQWTAPALLGLVLVMRGMCWCFASPSRVTGALAKYGHVVGLFAKGCARPTHQHAGSLGLSRKAGQAIGSGISLPHLRIHQVPRPLAQQRRAQVVHRPVGHGLAGFGGGRADVRQGHGIGQLEQRRIASGSFSYTSRPAPRMVPFCSASISAASSTTGPRRC
jgi:hypothetical protein